MKRALEIDDACDKHETIDAIRRLSPSAGEDFLSDFSERQLRAFLRRLEEVAAHRAAAVAQSGTALR